MRWTPIPPGRRAIGGTLRSGSGHAVGSNGGASSSMLTTNCSSSSVDPDLEPARPAAIAVDDHVGRRPRRSPGRGRRRIRPARRRRRPRRGRTVGPRPGGPGRRRCGDGRTSWTRLPVGRELRGPIVAESRAPRRRMWCGAHRQADCNGPEMASTRATALSSLHCPGARDVPGCPMARRRGGPRRARGPAIRSARPRADRVLGGTPIATRHPNGPSAPRDGRADHCAQQVEA